MIPKTYLPKSELVDWEYYVGTCRNAHVAQWRGTHFKHIRHKFGSDFIEEIKHPEDEAYYDVFYPIRKVERP